MTSRLRPLDPVADRDAVFDLFCRSADYVLHERGEAPLPAHADEYFSDVLPGAAPAAMRKLGAPDPDDPARLLAVVDMGFGYPGPDDAYLGLLQLAEDARGRGLGAALVREIEAIARAGGAARLYLAVLDTDPRGRAFWEREGFAVSLEGRRVRLGSREHLTTRMVKALG